ncbi:MAG: magnesium transporter CorA family protein [Polyangiales bacterium]
MEGLVLGSTAPTSDPARSLVRIATVDAIRSAHRSGHPLWVELGERTDELVALLQETFGLHPLVVEDIFSDRSAPKIEPLGEYLYIVVHALRPTTDPTRMGFVVLDVIVGKSFVLTQHRDGQATDRMRTRLEATPELLSKGSAWVTHAFLDAIIDRYLPQMAALVARVDESELRVLDRSAEDETLLPELVMLRRAVQSIHRISRHQEALLRELAQTDFALIPTEARPYFRDVHEHFSRVADDADRCVDVMTSTIEAHLSVQSNRMNATVKRLTLMSTVMLPLNLIASFYGMNFIHTPEFAWPYGRTAVVGLMLAVTAAVWMYFRRKRWV